jgi:hypothetical protein
MPYECESCNSFDTNEEKEKQAKQAKICGIICVDKMQTKLDNLSSLSANDKKALDVTLTKYFGVGVGETEMIRDISSNYEQIRATLALNPKLCNDSDKKVGPIDPLNENGMTRAQVKIPTEMNTAREILSGPSEDPENCVQFHLFAGFFSKEYTKNDQARVLIHEATHEGKLYKDSRENDSSHHIYLKVDGKSGYYESNGKFVEVEITPEDRLRLPDAYSYAAMDGCNCSDIKYEIKD